MGELPADLWVDAEGFYSTMEERDDLCAYENSRLKLFVDRNVLNNIWNQSIGDMKSGKETLGMIAGNLKKNRLNGENRFEYYITSARRLQGGLSEAEIDKKFGCLAPFIGGAVELDKAYPIFANDVGAYHTHPLVTSLKYGSARSGKDLDLPAQESSVDRESYSEIAGKIRSAKNYDLSLMPFCVSTSYAEAKVVWDIIFQQILSRYTSAKNPAEIKEIVFDSPMDFGDGILSRSFSAHKMGDSLKSFYEAATLGNYGAIVEKTKEFLKLLKQDGSTQETKLYGPDVNHIVRWVNAPILWEIARDDAVNSDILASYMMNMASADEGKSFRFPLYVTAEDDVLKYKRYPIGVEYFGNVAPSKPVAEFRQTYKKKFDKEFMGLASEINNSNGVCTSLNSLPEIRETFGYIDPATSIMHSHMFVERLSARGGM